jgi:transketolase
MTEKISFDRRTWKRVPGRDAFGMALIQIGEENKDLVFLTADCIDTTKGRGFATKFPDRSFNFGIAEANMIGAAAGMALLGKIPVAAGFGFLMSMRVAEQVRTDLCYPRLNVKIVASASGLAMGTGGPTHHCTEDIAIMRSFPNIAIVCPGSSFETWNACRAVILDHNGPVYLRLERDPFFENMEDLYAGREIPFVLGKAVTLREGKDVTLIGVGKPIGLALQAADVLEGEGIGARVVNMHTVKPLDKIALLKAAEETKGIVVVEEHNTTGGLGEAISSVICEEGIPTGVKKVGICDEFCCIGPTDDLWKVHGMTKENIIAAAKSLMDKRKC